MSKVPNMNKRRSDLISNDAVSQGSSNEDDITITGVSRPASQLVGSDQRKVPRLDRNVSSSLTSSQSTSGSSQSMHIDDDVVVTSIKRAPSTPSFNRQSPQSTPSQRSAVWVNDSGKKPVQQTPLASPARAGWVNNATPGRVPTTPVGKANPVWVNSPPASQALQNVNARVVPTTPGGNLNAVWINTLGTPPAAPGLQKENARVVPTTPRGNVNPVWVNGGETSPASQASQAVNAKLNARPNMVWGSQNQDEEEEVFLGYKSEKVVGIRYYHGLVCIEEHVIMRREPNNQYDRNAIQVLNANEVQVGHIPRETAATLAPLIDQGKIRVDGVVRGPKGAYDLPIFLYLNSTEQHKASVLQHLQARGYHLAVSGAGMIGRNTAQQDILGKSQVVKTMSPATVLERLSMSQVDLSKMPKAPQPKKLVTQLLSYQLQGLHWLISKEHPRLPETEGPTSQFWIYREKTQTIKQKHYFNVATNSAVSFDKPPKLCRGALLADDMGLGKTLQILSLIVSDPTGAGVVDTPSVPNGKYSKATLIVCPLSVISNWCDQIQQHIIPNTTSFHVFHGKDRIEDSKQLSTFDIVITTYNMVAQSMKSPEGGLHGVKWRRVILDEGHIIRNHKNKQSEAAFLLDGERRIIVSGTPIQNSIRDLYPVLKFLRYEPFDMHDWFKNVFVARGGSTGNVDLLKILMKELCLRRMKDMVFDGKPILELPKCTVHLVPVDFKYEEERKTYEALMVEFERKVWDLGQGPQQNYAHILEVLLRLRQTCDHLSLLGSRQIFLETAAKELFARANSTSTVSLSDPHIRKLLSILRENFAEDCAVCLDTMTKPVVTHCGHFFCKTCIEGVIQVQQGSPCPMCRDKLVMGELMELPTNFEQAMAEEEKGSASQSASQDDEVEDVDEETVDAEEEALKPSSKVDKIVEILGEELAKDSTTKAVIFSQWSKMLDVIAPFLKKAGINFVRFDGSMSRNARANSIRAFQTDPGTTVFLATLKSAGFGLNLVAGNLAFIVDPWWNGSVETQALDRINRLGQTRPVKIVRLVISGSVEERVLLVQERKRLVSSQAFDEEGKGKGKMESRESRMDDLKLLLGKGSEGSV